MKFGAMIFACCLAPTQFFCLAQASGSAPTLRHDEALKSICRNYQCTDIHIGKAKFRIPNAIIKYPYDKTRDSEAIAIYVTIDKSGIVLDDRRPRNIFSFKNKAVAQILIVSPVRADLHGNLMLIIRRGRVWLAPPVAPWTHHFWFATSSLISDVYFTHEGERKVRDMVRCNFPIIFKPTACHGYIVLNDLKIEVTFDADFFENWPNLRRSIEEFLSQIPAKAR